MRVADREVKCCCKNTNPQVCIDVFNSTLNFLHPNAKTHANIHADAYAQIAMMGTGAWSNLGVEAQWVRTVFASDYHRSQSVVEERKSCFPYAGIITTMSVVIVVVMILVQRQRWALDLQRLTQFNQRR
jgi:hypothetical protein